VLPGGGSGPGEPDRQLGEGEAAGEADGEAVEAGAWEAAGTDTLGAATDGTAGDVLAAGGELAAGDGAGLPAFAMNSHQAASRIRMMSTIASRMGPRSFRR
jgi:hypothetical protein